MTSNALNLLSLDLCSGNPPSGAAERAAKITALRKLIAGDKKHGVKAETLDAVGASEAVPLWQTGVAEIDAALPKQSLSRTGVHEVSGQTHHDTPTASAYLTALLKQLAKASEGTVRRTVLWCQTATVAREFGRLYGRGLMSFGFDPGDVVFVQGVKNKDLLWALEEGARAATLLAVVGEVDALSFTHARRLTLAARAGGTPVLILRPYHDQTASAAETRWRLTARPSAGDPFVPEVPGHPCWQVTLTRSRGGQSGSWCVEWQHETHCFHLAEHFFSRWSEAPNPAQHVPGLRSAYA